VDLFYYTDGRETGKVTLNSEPCENRDDFIVEVIGIKKSGNKIDSALKGKPRGMKAGRKLPA